MSVTMRDRVLLQSLGFTPEHLPLPASAITAVLRSGSETIELHLHHRAERLSPVTDFFGPHPDIVGAVFTTPEALTVVFRFPSQMASSLRSWVAQYGDGPDDGDHPAWGCIEAPSLVAN